ncbi:MAG: S8 family serine peptidase [Gemmobacter sp.]
MSEPTHPVRSGAIRTVTTRRRMLLRLGLAAGAAYAAPAVFRLDPAHASDGDDGGGAGEAGGPDRSPARSRRTVRQAVRRPPPPPELIVLLPEGATIAPALAAGYEVLDEWSNRVIFGTTFRLALPAGRGIEAARAELAVLIPGALADANSLYRPDDFPCDGGDCAAHRAIGWSGWPSLYAPRIGMVDTAINPDHPALTGQRLTILPGRTGGRSPAGAQHGTAVAALLVGRVEGRVPGLLPNADLLAVDAFHAGAGGAQSDAFAIAAAIDTLAAEGAGVINLSLSGPANAVLERVTTEVALKGVGLVAAAGNGGPGAGPTYPAAWPHVLAVTAVDSRGRVYRQANQGPWISLAAPGVGVWTAASVSGGRLRSGTSYAAPFVTATLAVQRMRAPQLPLDEVIAGLLACAEDMGAAGFDPVFGHGMVRAPFACSAGAYSLSGQ